MPRTWTPEQLVRRREAWKRWREKNPWKPKPRRYKRKTTPRAKSLVLIKGRLYEFEYLGHNRHNQRALKPDAPLPRSLPLTRADCEDGPRPCPYVSCKAHLYLDVNPETGSIKLNFPDKEPWELDESCSLDVADRGGITLEEVGAIVNLTRERVRQIEVRATAKLRQLHGVDLHGENPLDTSSRRGVASFLAAGTGPASMDTTDND